RDVNGQWVDGGYASLIGTQWSWTPDQALGEGKWEFRANAVNGWTDEFTLEIDLTPVSELAITHAWDDFGINTGLLHSGAITDDRTPTLNGRAEANSIVYIHFRNALSDWEVLGSVQAGADGSWVYETDRISPGSYQFSASNNAQAHNSNSDFALTIVSDAGLTPQIISAYDNFGKVTGALKSGATTDDATPEIRGVAEANSTVYVEYRSAGGAWQTGYSVQTDHAGKWSFTPPQQLANGEWQFIAKNSNNENTSPVFDLKIQPDVFNKTFTENFSNFTVKEITDSSLVINGATITFSGEKSRITDLLNSRHLHLGTYGSNTSAKMVIDLDYLTNKISFDAYGIENSHSPATIIIYDQYNNIIKTEICTIHQWSKYSYTAPEGKMIGKIDISVAGEYMGFDIDNFSYTALDYKQNYLNEPEKNAVFKDDNADANHFLPITKNATINIDDDITVLNSKLVLVNGEKDIFIENDYTQLMVMGNEGDTVKLQDVLPEEALTNWTQQTGTVTIAGVQYEVYSHNGSDAELLVQEGVKVELI
ncbi:hypothetical protein CBW22_24015, partial [Pantoea sp. VS1]|uniref:Ig-like domain-containing protein n=1 Tax=Pantoea sp. VS1 TaxID=2003658 RepID=UPI000B69AEFC